MKRGILATRDELRQLRGRIGRKAFAGMYDALRKRCALILESPPVTEAQWQSLWQQGRWGSATQAARAVQGRVMDLLIAHHIDRNAAYRDRAVEELTNLANWSTWTDPCHNHIAADLCTAEAAVALAVGLDWLWEDLPAADRDGLVDVLSHKAVAAYDKAAGEGAFWTECYHAWNAVCNAGIGLAALALSDDDPAAAKVYQAARGSLGRFFDALGRDGGWDEGVGFWGYAMRYVLLLAEAARRLEDDQTLLHRRGMDATGLFGVYFTPNGQAASFGDGASVPLLGTFYLLPKHYRRREVTWWLDTYAFHRDVSTTGFSAAGLAILFRPPNARTPARPDLKPVKVFESVGWGALADTWPKPTMHAAVKTGDLSANHSHLDMNSLLLQVDGEMLLTEPGSAPASREYLSEARGEFYEVQARAHNTLVVAERDHRIDARGQIVATGRGESYRYVACDAESALGENVRFVRHVVLAVDPADGAGRALVVLDDLLNGVPEKVEMFWHTQGRIELDAEARAGTITGRRSRLHFAIASTANQRAFRKSYPINVQRRDHVLQTSAGVVGRALTATVFSRRPIDGETAVAETADGVEVSAGALHLTFAQSGRHLKLRKVTLA